MGLKGTHHQCVGGIFNDTLPYVDGGPIVLK